MEKKYSCMQLTALVVLRILIGWHFLYEGIAKLLNPYWTSAGFLSDSKGFLSGFFSWIAETPSVLKVVDFLNIWGLIAIGVALIAGFFTRTAVVSGMVLLLLYYLANPPFIGYSYTSPAEGNYLFVNKNLIEMFSLSALLFFPTGKIIGLDRLLLRKKTAD
ncbi:MAG: DoxX family protein [Candidatus Aminicenantes bacterium]|nr:DoxX family protein [Candidatus Aminicenantes bacterium]